MGNTCCGDNNNLKNEELDSRNPPKKESKESKAGLASSDFSIVQTARLIRI